MKYKQVKHRVKTMMRRGLEAIGLREPYYISMDNAKHLQGGWDQ